MLLLNALGFHNVGRTTRARIGHWDVNKVINVVRRLAMSLGTILVAGLTTRGVGLILGWRLGNGAA